MGSVSGRNLGRHEPNLDKVDQHERHAEKEARENQLRDQETCECLSGAKAGAEQAHADPVCLRSLHQLPAPRQRS
jgi:hypothetical protein